LCLSYIIIFRNYDRPAQFIWDENYHVASAQKYLNGVYFMEPHPPLGKLLIAAGEWLVDANPADDQFLSTDHADIPPPGFSFRGYRLFPVILAMLCPALLYLLMRAIGVGPLSAGLGASLLLFDNSFVVHVRSAMLEGTQIFFILSNLVAVVAFSRATRYSRLLGIVCGILFGCIAATKVNGLIVAAFAPVALLERRKRRELCVLPVLYALLSALVVYLAVWQIHFSLGRTLNPKLPNKGW
jgi:dolichyl-phosphate-mannose--protein O-mannosyl transferase